MRVALVCLGALLLGACALVEPQVPVRRSVRAGASEPTLLFAGAARVALTPVQRPVPLAGFGPRPALASEVDRGIDGRPIDLTARALSLRGEGELDGEREGFPRRRAVDRLVLASVDQLVVTGDFRALVLERLADLARAASPGLDLARTELVLTATHTHEGIGGFWKGTLPEWASIGPWDADRTRTTATRVAKTILAAIEAERPARVAWGSRQCPALVQSRAAHTDLVDPSLLALALDGEDGKAIARVLVFASHPTELHGTEHLSPAWPGAACDALEREGGVALVLQGGLGDQRPLFPAGVGRSSVPSWYSPRLARSRVYGDLVGQEGAAALREKPRTPRATLRLARAPLALPFPTLGACPIPVLDRLLAAPAVLPYWPAETELAVLRIGDVALAFAPFELCAATSLRLRARLRAAGYEEAGLVSLANDWLGYAPDVFPFPWTTSGATSFGGTALGYVVGERLSEMGERVGPARPR